MFSTISPCFKFHELKEKIYVVSFEIFMKKLELVKARNVH